MKKTITGKIVHNKEYDSWSFETEEQSYSADVPTALDELFGDTTCNGDIVTITIEIQ